MEDQRGHIRSDWHGYNLKQKLRGGTPVTENEFEKLVESLEDSLSGSDSSDSDEDADSAEKGRDTILSSLLKKQARIHDSNGAEADDDSETPKRQRGPGKPPLLWFSTPGLPSNTRLGIYRAIFNNSEQEQETKIVDILRQKQLAPRPPPKIDNKPLPAGVLAPAHQGPHIFMCMIGGGHFAAMVVSLPPRLTRGGSLGPLSREATVLAQKSFHRYTTRRKQGGSQSSFDSGGRAAQSAGSALRRYNETALTEEVRQLLSDWKDLIDTSDLIFVRATGTTNRRTLFGPYEGQVLRQTDPRVRGFPFTTRRATQQELMRSFIELTRVKVRDIDEAKLAAEAAAREEAEKQKAAAKIAKVQAPAKPQRSEEEETALLHTTQIQALIRRSKVPALLQYVQTNDLSPDFRFHPETSPQHHHTPTALHLAASTNSPSLVSGLLVKADASPLLRNGDGKTPYDLAGDRPTRDAFRVARSMLGENRWDWDAAHVPPAITKAEADERETKEKQEEAQQEAERRRAETERLKREGPKVVDNSPLGRAAGRGRALALGAVQHTAQERRDEEARGLTPEMRMRLERERRARAAEERIKKLQGGR